MNPHRPATSRFRHLLAAASLGALAIGLHAGLCRYPAVPALLQRRRSAASVGQRQRRRHPVAERHPAGPRQPEGPPVAGAALPEDGRRGFRREGVAPGLRGAARRRGRVAAGAGADDAAPLRRRVLRPVAAGGYARTDPGQAGHERSGLYRHRPDRRCREPVPRGAGNGARPCRGEARPCPGRCDPQPDRRGAAECRGGAAPRLPTIWKRCCCRPTSPSPGRGRTMRWRASTAPRRWRRTTRACCCREPGCGFRPARSTRRRRTSAACWSGRRSDVMARYMKASIQLLRGDANAARATFQPIEGALADYTPGLAARRPDQVQHRPVRPGRGVDQPVPGGGARPCAGAPDAGGDPVALQQYP